MASPYIRLVSKEGESLTISKEAALGSLLLKRTLETLETTEDIPLPTISTDILKQVLEYLRHYAVPAIPPTDIEKPIKSTNLAELVPEWDNQFMDKPQEDVFELVLAANYLEIHGLLDLVCAKVATMIKGKTPEEIKRTFNIVNDFTPEEEAQIREENRWADED